MRISWGHVTSLVLVYVFVRFFGCQTLVVMMMQSSRGDSSITIIIIYSLLFWVFKCLFLYSFFHLFHSFDSFDLFVPLFTFPFFLYSYSFTPSALCRNFDFCTWSCNAPGLRKRCLEADVTCGDSSGKLDVKRILEPKSQIWKEYHQVPNRILCTFSTVFLFF